MTSKDFGEGERYFVENDFRGAKGQTPFKIVGMVIVILLVLGLLNALLTHVGCVPTLCN